MDIKLSQGWKSSKPATVKDLPLLLAKLKCSSPLQKLMC